VDLLSEPQFDEVATGLQLLQEFEGPSVRRMSDEGLQQPRIVPVETKFHSLPVITSRTDIAAAVAGNESVDCRCTPEAADVGAIFLITAARHKIPPAGEARSCGWGHDVCARQKYAFVFNAPLCALLFYKHSIKPLKTKGFMICG
jgi:hypothetical protein